MEWCSWWFIILISYRRNKRGQRWPNHLQRLFMSFCRLSTFLHYLLVLLLHPSLYFLKPPHQLSHSLTYLFEQPSFAAGSLRTSWRQQSSQFWPFVDRAVIHRQQGAAITPLGKWLARRAGCRAHGVFLWATSSSPLEAWVTWQGQESVALRYWSSAGRNYRHKEMEGTVSTKWKLVYHKSD